MGDALSQEVATGWMAAMRRGDWEGAWQQTDRIELPRRRQPLSERRAEHLVWRGEPFVGRSVLVRCEHGLGDTLQFIRFVPELVRIASKVTVMVQPALLPLLSAVPGLGDARNGWTADWPSGHEVEIEVMELAYAFRSTTATLPPSCPGLAESVAGRPPKLPPGDGRIRVGLLWAASEWDRSRSLPPELLEPLLRCSHAQVFGLQQGPEADDGLAERLGIIPLWRQTKPIEAAASAMCQLDLVITIDAMGAHLSGSLGRPTWLLLKHQADWRWMEGRSDSPWYPRMRLFRQPAPGDWAAAMEGLVKALQQWN